MISKRIFACTAAAVMLFTGCTFRKSGADTAAKPAPDFMPLTDIVDGRKNIYLIVKNLESSYWQVVIDGAKAGGEDFGCNVYYSGSYTENDWESQERLLDDAEKAGADAVLLSPNDSVMLAEKIDEVYDKGIKMILVDTIANTQSYDICYMTDNLIAGQDAAREMLTRFKERGLSVNEEAQVCIQVGATSSQTINERLAGFLQYWTNNAPEAWEVVDDIRCNEGDAEIAVDLAEDIIDDYSENIKGVFGTNNGSTAGFARVVADRERTDITVVGFDYSEDIAKLIDSEEYDAATMVQRQFQMSYGGVDEALKLIRGEAVEQKFVDTGVVVVNKATRHDPEVEELLENS